MSTAPRKVTIFLMWSYIDCAQNCWKSCERTGSNVTQKLPENEKKMLQNFKKLLINISHFIHITALNNKPV